MGVQKGGRMTSRLKDSLWFITVGLVLVPWIIFIPSLWNMANGSPNSTMAKLYLFISFLIVLSLPIGISSIYLGIKNLIRR
jgi:hypothetical protein